MFSVTAFCLTFVLLVAGLDETSVAGRILMRSATTNGITLRAYVADVVLPRRTFKGRALETCGLGLIAAGQGIF